jgi:shikimate 5-dehydrogenase
LNIDWDKAADVVIVGFGGAAAAAAVTAHDLGAKVVLLEKAPEGEEEIAVDRAHRVARADAAEREALADVPGALVVAESPWNRERA